MKYVLLIIKVIEFPKLFYKYTNYKLDLALVYSVNYSVSLYTFHHIFKDKYVSTSIKKSMQYTTIDFDNATLKLEEDDTRTSLPLPHPHAPHPNTLREIQSLERRTQHQQPCRAGNYTPMDFQGVCVVHHREEEIEEFNPPMDSPPRYKKPQNHKSINHI